MSGPGVFVRKDLQGFVGGGWGAGVRATIHQSISRLSVEDISQVLD